MLQTQHKGNKEYNITFKQDENLGEDVSRIYKLVQGYSQKEEVNYTRINTSVDVSEEELLEAIDQIRFPLAEKRLEGEDLSETQLIYLEILDSLTDKVLSRFAPEPEESIDVKLALEEAKRIAQNK